MAHLPAHGRQLIPGARGHASSSAGSRLRLVPEATRHPGPEALFRGCGDREPARAPQSSGAGLRAARKGVRESSLPPAVRVDPLLGIRRPALVLAAYRRNRDGFRGRRDAARTRGQVDAEDRLPPPEGASEGDSRSPPRPTSAWLFVPDQRESLPEAVSRQAPYGKMFGGVRSVQPACLPTVGVRRASVRSPAHWQEGSATAPGPRADRASAHPLPRLSPSSAHRMAANVAAPKTPNAAIWAYMVPS